MATGKGAKTIMGMLDEFYTGTAKSVANNMRDSGSTLESVLETGKKMTEMGYGKGALYGAAGLGAVDMVMGRDYNPMTGIMLGAMGGAAGAHLARKAGAKMPGIVDDCYLKSNKAPNKVKSTKKGKAK